MSTLKDEIKTLLRMKIKSFIPIDLMYKLRSLRNKRARNNLASKNVNVKKHSASELREQLEASGIDRKRDIIMQSSFSKIGADCRAEEIVQMFIDYMDPSANILMPAFPAAATAAEWIADPRPFDVQNSPSMMGVITEVFRRRPDTLRSMHPTHSVSVRGPDAEWYTKDHHRHPAPAGPMSPFARLHERDGQIVNIGIGVRNIPATHVTNETFRALPFATLLPEPLSKRVMNNGHEQSILTQVGNPALSPWRIDNYPPKLRQFTKLYKEQAGLKSFKFGSTEVVYMGMRQLVELQTKLAKSGITIYHRPKNWIVRKIAGYPH